MVDFEAVLTNEGSISLGPFGVEMVADVEGILRSFEENKPLPLLMGVGGPVVGEVTEMKITDGIITVKGYTSTTVVLDGVGAQEANPS